MNETLGSYLKSVRKQRQLTLRSVEEKTGIPNAHVSQVENGRIGRPSLEVLQKLAGCYGTSYRFLVELAGYPLPEPSTVPENQLQPRSRMSDNLGDLTGEELDRVMEYVQFLRSKRVKK